MYFAVVAAVFGAAIGSFLNVVILRYGVRGVGGRSACMSCQRTLKWYELVPVFSWIVLRGRCSSCGVRISIQYPLVELAMAGLLALIAGALAPQLSLFMPSAFISLVLYGSVSALLLAIAVYDMYHMIIPDPWVYSFCALAFFSQLFFVPSAFGLVITVLAGPLAALPLFLLWLFSRGTWMGFGDVKLALGIGWMLGPFAGAFAVLFAFMIGGVFAVPLLVFSSAWWRSLSDHFARQGASPWGKMLSKSIAGFTMKSEVAFGPFLIASTFLIWFSTLYGLTIPLLP